jgi:hypothetical protein
MTAFAVEAPHAMKAAPEAADLPSGDDPSLSATACATVAGVRSCALNLSRTRTHDAVLDILNVYKLSGNFHSNLDAVLNDMGYCDIVTYRVEPGPAFAFQDCRHVVLTLNDGVPAALLGEVAGAMKARIGFDAPWWGRLLYRQPDTLGARPMCRSDY